MGIRDVEVDPCGEDSISEFVGVQLNADDAAGPSESVGGRG
jgi:hypothetical protein